MIVYLAARYDRKEELYAYSKELKSHGVTIGSRWIYNEMEEFESFGIVHEIWATIDVEDIHNADVIILFSESPTARTLRGGRHVEFGVALAMKKKLIIVGPKENIFHTLPQVHVFPEWGADVIECARGDSEKE